MTSQYLLKKKDLNDLILRVMKDYQVLAPVKGDPTKLRTRSR